MGFSAADMGLDFCWLNDGESVAEMDDHGRSRG
jgi:hypothetical protein